MTSIATPLTNALVPATIPYGRAQGHTTETVLSNPLSGMFHCADCDFTAESYGKVWAHRRVHAAPKPKKVAPVETPQEKVAQAVHLLVAAHTALDVPADDSDKVKALRYAADEWKTRALAAEKSLKSLRRILGTDA